jgi:hypothetical protein
LKESEFVEALNDFVDEKATYKPLLVTRPVRNPGRIAFPVVVFVLVVVVVVVVVVLLLFY